MNPISLFRNVALTAGAVALYAGYASRSKDHEVGQWLGERFKNPDLWLSVRNQLARTSANLRQASIEGNGPNSPLGALAGTLGRLMRIAESAAAKPGFLTPNGWDGEIRPDASREPNCVASKPTSPASQDISPQFRNVCRKGMRLEDLPKRLSIPNIAWERALAQKGVVGSSSTHHLVDTDRGPQVISGKKVPPESTIAQLVVVNDTLFDSGRLTDLICGPRSSYPKLAFTRHPGGMQAKMLVHTEESKATFSELSGNMGLPKAQKHVFDTIAGVRSALRAKGLTWEAASNGAIEYAAQKFHLGLYVSGSKNGELARVDTAKWDVTQEANKFARGLTHWDADLASLGL